MLVANVRLDLVRIRCDLPNHWLLVRSHSDVASCEGELAVVTSASYLSVEIFSNEDSQLVSIGRCNKSSACLDCPENMDAPPNQGLT